MKGAYIFYNALSTLNFKSNVMDFVSASMGYRESIISCTFFCPLARYEYQILERFCSD